MQTKDRKENPLLNRVEIEFSWNHEGKATPSRSEILNQVASLEPGANKDLIVIKNVNTRFGVGITTGSASFSVSHGQSKHSGRTFLALTFGWARTDVVGVDVVGGN